MNKKHQIEDHSSEEWSEHETATLTRLIPSLSSEDIKILAQSSVNIPVHRHEKRSELKRIVSKAILNRRTDPDLRMAMKKWLDNDWSQELTNKMCKDTDQAVNN